VSQSNSTNTLSAIDGPRRPDEKGPSKAEARLAWRTDAGEGRNALARVVTVTEHGLVVRLGEPLQVGQTIWIREQPADRVAIVLSCLEQVSGYLVSLQIRPLERRRESRPSAGGAGTLHWTSPNGAKRALVSVRDMTDVGMRLEVPERLEANQRIRLSGENWECQGVVRYCEPAGDRFVAGVELTRPPYEKNCLEYQD